MASYGYQYGTSARKLEPERKSPKKSPKKQNKCQKNKSKNYRNRVKKEMEAKTARTNFAILMVIALGCILLLMYRSVKIRESFAGVQTLSKRVSALEKENSQIAVNIQNSLNINNVESIASSSLGMQKLSSKQTIYINLDTKDYVEVSTKKVVKEKKISFIQRIINRIVDYF